MSIQYTNDNNNLIHQLQNNVTIINNALSSEIENKKTLNIYIDLFKNDVLLLDDIIQQIIITDNNIKNLETLQNQINNLNKLYYNKCNIELELLEYNNFFSATFNTIFCSNSKRENLLQTLLKGCANKTNFQILLDNNILLISEKEQKVFLPYKKKNIENILLVSDKYTCYEEIIKDLYIIPLQRYINSSLARFKEAFNLMNKKECSSFFKSLDFALEMFSKYNLHPAIISACQNLDELDIYLDCLDNNDLDKFDLFEIKYEMSPSIIKKKDLF